MQVELAFTSGDDGQRKEGLCVSVEGELWYNTRLKNRKKEDESLQIRRFVAC